MKVWLTFCISLYRRVEQDTLQRLSLRRFWRKWVFDKKELVLRSWVTTLAETRWEHLLSPVSHSSQWTIVPISASQLVLVCHKDFLIFMNCYLIPTLIRMVRVELVIRIYDLYTLFYHFSKDLLNLFYVYFSLPHTFINWKKKRE